MESKILSGKPVALSIIDRLKFKLADCRAIPTMALIRVGNDPASAFYVQNIIKQGTKLGMDIRLIEVAESLSNGAFAKLVDQYNQNNDYHGIMIQKPLPKHIDETLIDNLVSPDKDIDGINPINIGRLFLNQPSFVPCTAAAVIEILKFYQIKTAKKNVVILGRSSVVGKPLIGLLLQKHDFGNATVTVCHSHSKDIPSIIRSCDIIIAAIGSPKFVTADMISENTICIDVGINQILDAEKGAIYVGDIDYQTCLGKASAMTPVPGGIGSITTSILLENLVIATLLQNH